MPIAEPEPLDRERALHAGERFVEAFFPQIHQGQFLVAPCGHVVVRAERPRADAERFDQQGARFFVQALVDEQTGESVQRAGRFRVDAADRGGSVGDRAVVEHARFVPAPFVLADQRELVHERGRPQVPGSELFSQDLKAFLEASGGARILAHAEQAAAQPVPSVRPVDGLAGTRCVVDRDGPLEDRQCFAVATFVADRTPQVDQAVRVLGIVLAEVPGADVERALQQRFCFAMAAHLHQQVAGQPQVPGDFVALRPGLRLQLRQGQTMQLERALEVAQHAKTFRKSGARVARRRISGPVQQGPNSQGFLEQRPRCGEAAELLELLRQVELRVDRVDVFGTDVAAPRLERALEDRGSLSVSSLDIAGVGEPVERREGVEIVRAEQFFAHGDDFGKAHVADGDFPGAVAQPVEFDHGLRGGHRARAERRGDGFELRARVGERQLAQRGALEHGRNAELHAQLERALPGRLLDLADEPRLVDHAQPVFDAAERRIEDQARMLAVGPVVGLGEEHARGIAQFEPRVEQVRAQVEVDRPIAFDQEAILAQRTDEFGRDFGTRREPRRRCRILETRR